MARHGRAFPLSTGIYTPITKFRTGDNYTTAPADAIQGTDAVVKTIRVNLADSATVTDAISNKPGKAIVETASVITDAQTKAVTHPVADSAAGTDNFARVVSFIRSVADTGTLGDSTATVDGNHVIADETLAVTDAISKRVVCGTQADSASITDASLRSPGKTVSDSAAATDASVRSLVKALSDAASATDAQAKALVRLFADALAITDDVDAGIPAAEPPPDTFINLGGIFDETLTGGVVTELSRGGVHDEALTGAAVGNNRSGVHDETNTGGSRDEGARSGAPDEPNRSGELL